MVNTSENMQNNTQSSKHIYWKKCKRNARKALQIQKKIIQKKMAVNTSKAEEKTKITQKLIQQKQQTQKKKLR